MTTIGVLALQGDVREHRSTLERIGVLVRDVRQSHDLEGIDGLIIPGGESTTMARLLGTSGLRESLTTRLATGFPVFGTCAGLIMLANQIQDGRDDQWSFSALDITVRRNGYGRQVASFETTVRVHEVGAVPGVFIRAPRVTAVGPSVTVLANHDHGDGPHPVLVRQGRALGCSFHPELTSSTAVHEYFVTEVVAGSL
jgi:pyridoxal 5'-phosphate synthase pdxT subunit